MRIYAHVVLDRRLQILIDEERYERLVAAAATRGVSVATVVRDAIDRGVPSQDDERRAAWARILATPPIDVPEDYADLRKEIEEARSRWR